jgi:two-component system, NarL family, nitrate/nitrite response regulator NarL
MNSASNGFGFFNSSASHDEMPPVQRGPVLVHIIAPPLVSWGLQRLVQTAGAPFWLVGVSATLHDALDAIERQQPDVVVLDIDDGYDMQDLGSIYQRTRSKVLALTHSADGAFLSRLLESGARGVLYTRDAPSVLLKALEVVGRGEVFASQAATQGLFMAAASSLAQPARGETSVAKLTLRERQTFAAVVRDANAPVKVIADRLCISEHTVRNHLTSIYSKLGVSSRVALHAYASEHRISGGSDKPC